MSSNHMKNKTLAYEKILTVSSRILRKKATYKKTFFSMMARVWEKGTYRKKFVLPVIQPLFFFFFAIFAMSKNPWNQFEGCDIVLSLCFRHVKCTDREI